MRLMSPPATGTVNKSPLVLMASILSVTAVKQISLLSGEKLISPGPPRSSGGTSKSAPEVRSRGAALPSAGRTNKWLRVPSFQWVQWRQRRCSATWAFTWFFSFSSSRFLLQSSSLQSGYTEEVIAIVFPLGDHFTRPAPVVNFVRRWASPPSSPSKYTWASPLREERKAMVFPSGDHTGEESCPLRVSCVGAPPEVETIQMLLTLRLDSMSGVATV